MQLTNYQREIIQWARSRADVHIMVKTNAGAYEYRGGLVDETFGPSVARRITSVMGTDTATVTRTSKSPDGEYTNYQAYRVTAKSCRKLYDETT